MASKDLSGFNGSVTFPSGAGGPASKFTVRRRMSQKPTNIYGGDRFSRSRGGMIMISGDISFFLQMGATGSSPNFIDPAADGASLTLTLETGCTLVGVALFPDLTVNHSFEDPAIEGTQSYQFNGAVAETWAVA